MFNGPAPLSILAAVLALGAIGLALALASIGVPFLLAALLAAAACGLVQFGASRQQATRLPDHPGADPSAEAALLARLEEYRRATASLRHDLRGVMSPALMVSDRLLSHEDPGVQRAGQAVVRSVERATALLADHREVLTGESPGAATPPPP